MYKRKIFLIGTQIKQSGAHYSIAESIDERRERRKKKKNTRAELWKFQRLSLPHRRRRRRRRRPNTCRRDASDCSNPLHTRHETVRTPRRVGTERGGRRVPPHSSRAGGRAVGRGGTPLESSAAADRPGAGRGRRARHGKTARRLDRCHDRRGISRCSAPPRGECQYVLLRRRRRRGRTRLGRTRCYRALAVQC